MNKLLCMIGFHNWGDIEVTPIEITDPHILFSSWGKQNGKKTCRRCGKVQKLCRSGFAGIGYGEPKWHKVI